jgi:hypothetical protein
MQTVQISYVTTENFNSPLYINGTFCENLPLQKKTDTSDKFTYYINLSLDEGAMLSKKCLILQELTTTN